MTPDRSPRAAPLVILGCGYVGGYLARAALARDHVGDPARDSASDGEAGRVRVCARNVDRLAPLAALGAEVRMLDATKSKQFGPAMAGITGAVVVYSIPPPPNFPAGEAVRRAASAALAAGARSFIYLGTSGVYGNRPSDEIVDEDTSLALSDSAMSARISDESAVQAAAAGGLRTIVLRLAAIYGPGRGVRVRMRRGDYKLIDGGDNWFSRIHVLDLVQVIRAAAERAPASAVYCVADDRPAQQREYASWLAEHLGLPAPRVGTAGDGVTAHATLHRGRRVRNARMKSELGVALAYPSFIEGELQIDEAEKVEG